ncbi:MAG: tetratricopeptide repeat protein [Acidobacteria bacterium]|nr:tetratricopeptide repeat protein [Acidobacteriota bacterium]
MKHLTVVRRTSKVDELMRPAVEALATGCHGNPSECAICGRLPDHVDTEKGDPWPDAAESLRDRIWIGECSGGLHHKVQQCPQCHRLYFRHESFGYPGSDEGHEISLARTNVDGVLKSLSGRNATVLIERSDGLWVVSDRRLSEYLNTASYLGDLDSVKLWLDAGVRPDAKGEDTALITAVRGGHANVVKFLLARGMNAASRNSAGKSALDFARESGRPDLAEMLIEAGGELGDWRQELENMAWKKKWQAARQKAEEVLKIFPDNVDALFYYGVGCGATGDPVRAEQCLSRVVKKRPRHYDAWYNLGIAALVSNDPARAVGYLERAVSLSPDNHDALFKLGEAREKAGDIEGGIAAYEAAVRTRPDRWGGVVDHSTTAGSALRRLRSPKDKKTTRTKKHT